MELTDKERLSLALQLRILEKVDPEGARRHAEVATILERGYEGFYGEALQYIDKDAVSSAACTEVIDILNLYRALDTYKRGGGSHDSYNFDFRGFDGNNETHHYSFARFLRHDQGKWAELSGAPDNSHGPTLFRYRQMVRVWKSLGGGHDLTEQQVTQILAE